MQRNSSILDNWIKDFDLASPEDGSICFKAIVQYETAAHYKQMESEIHVIHIRNKNLAVIYLLEPDIVKHQIPDMLYFNTAHFTYHKHRTMEINDTYKNRKYKMKLIPVERMCSDATKAELYAKANN